MRTDGLRAMTPAQCAEHPASVTPTWPPKSVHEGKQRSGEGREGCRGLGICNLRAETLRPHQPGEAGAYGSVDLSKSDTDGSEMMRLVPFWHLWHLKVSCLPATPGEELPRGHVSAGGRAS